MAAILKQFNRFHQFSNSIELMRPRTCVRSSVKIDRSSIDYYNLLTPRRLFSILVYDWLFPLSIMKLLKQFSASFVSNSRSEINTYISIYLAVITEINLKVNRSLFVVTFCIPTSTISLFGNYFTIEIRQVEKSWIVIVFSKLLANFKNKQTTANVQTLIEFEFVLSCEFKW